METTTSACPYCNAALPPLTAPPTVERIPCPRCGELVPASRWQLGAAPPALPSPAMSTAIRGVPATRQTALTVLGIMVAMAAVGLSYALWTVKERRARDPKGLLDLITYRKPLELHGLGFLPERSDVVVGLHLAEWLADKKVGKPLLEEPRPAGLDWVVRQLPRLTGLPLEELDHAVLAASFDPLQVVMIVRARRPFDLGKVSEHAKSSQAPLYRDRPLYEINVNPFGDALLWFVEDKTLVCLARLDGAKLPHLAAVSATPRTVEEVMPESLHAALKERLPRFQFAWAVGRLDRLGALKDALAFVPMGKANTGVVKDIKTFALGLEPVEGLTLTGHFQAVDAKSAARLKALLEGVKFEGAKVTIVMPPEAEAEQWLTWQLRGDVAALREWLNSFSARKAPRER